jgi:chromosome segregation ATPase
MEVSVELVGVGASLGAAIVGQWVTLWRKLSHNETKLAQVKECLDDAQAKISTQNERLSRIEGRMQEREMRWEERILRENGGVK